MRHAESQLPDSQICKIVKYDWLANSINLMEKQDEEPYVLTKEALLAVKKPKDTKRKKPMSEEDGSQTVEQISSKKSSKSSNIAVLSLLNTSNRDRRP